MINGINSVLLTARRSPFCPKGGPLDKFPIQKIAGQVIKETTRESGLLTDDFNKEVTQAIIGCATQAGTQGINVGRRALLEAFGPNANSIFCRTVNSSCASSLDAIILADMMIKSGKADYVITAGFDANVDGQAPAGSDAQYQTTNPIGYIKNFLSTLLLSLKFGRDPTRLGGEILKRTMPPDYTFVQMNESGDFIARLLEIEREKLDRYSAMSFARAVDAAANGIFKKEIVPIDMGPYGYVDQDQIREVSTLFAQRNLRTTIKDGLHHAGSSSLLGVGASCAIVANEEKALASGRVPLARIIDWVETGVGAGVGQLLGPLEAVEKLLKQNNLTMNDMDLVEVNEAYAALVVAMQDKFNIPDEKLNVHGGALAMGHPFGASGGRIAAHLVHEMQRRAVLCGPEEKKPKYALETMCVAQGLAPAVILERWDHEEYLKRTAA